MHTLSKPAKPDAPVRPETEKSTPPICRRMTLWILLVVGIGVILYSVILLPLYMHMRADILLATSVWLTVIEWLCEIVQTVSFFLAYACLFYAIWRGGVRGATGGVIAFAALTVLKFAANFMATCITNRSFPGWTAFWKQDLPLIQPQLFLELCQHALVIAVAVCVLYAYRRAHPRAVGLTTAEGFLADRKGVFPLAKLVSWKNPLLRSMLLAVLIVLIGRLANYAIGIISFAILWDTAIDWSALFYEMLPDLVAWIISYFAMILLLSAFDRGELLRLTPSADRSQAEAKK